MKTLTHNLKTLLLSAPLLFSVSAHAQMLSAGETDKLYNEAESLDKAGDNIMTEFILMQQADKYEKAVEKYNSADSIYSILLKYGTEPESLAGIMGIMIEANQVMISSKKMLIGKEEILAEKSADRNKSVKYNRQSYKLSKSSKSYFHLLQPKK